MGARNNVVDNAVERISWGKSRNELMCRFQYWRTSPLFWRCTPWNTNPTTNIT